MNQSSDRHNELARGFVQKVAGETRSDAEMMVVIETTILAGMLILSRVHGYSPSSAANLMEAAVHRAVERLTEQVRQ